MKERIGLVVTGYYENMLEGYLCDLKISPKITKKGNIIIKRDIIRHGFKIQYSSNTVMVAAGTDIITAKEIVEELIKAGVDNPKLCFNNKTYTVKELKNM